jgi:hypothetical protein
MYIFFSGKYKTMSWLVGGLAGSQSIEQTFNMSALTKSIFEYTSKNTLSVSQSSTNINRLQLNVGGDMVGCPYTSDQSIDASMVADVRMIPQTILDMKDDIKNEFNTLVQSALEKTSEFGNLQLGEQQDMTTNVNINVKNIIEKVVTLENVTTLVQEAVQINEDQINIKGNLICEGNAFDRNQNITSKMAAEALVGALATAASQNSTLNSIHTELVADAKSESKGLSDIFDSVFGGATDWMKYASFACVICVCILAIAGVIFALSPAGQNATRNIVKNKPWKTK